MAELSGAEKQNLYKQLYQRQVAELQNVNVVNPKLMIAFAGPPGSGKSSLAKDLEQRFKGVRLENDRLRVFLDELTPQLNMQERNQLITDYNRHYLLKKITEIPNGLLILDSSIDRKYKDILEFAQVNNYKLYIISFDLPRHVLEDRIKQYRDPADGYLAELGRWIKEHEEFQKAVKPDITLGKNDDYSPVFKNIEQILAK